MNDIVPISLSLKGKDVSLMVGEATIRNIQQALSKRAKMLGKVRCYEFKGQDGPNTVRGYFTDPIYDLSEIARVSDIEPYIAQSIRRHRELILKEGFQIIGPEKAMVDYIYKRLFEMSLLTGISTDQWLRDLTNNVIMFHNGFLVYRRDAERSTGAPTRVFGKDLDPIAGIFVGDPTSMQVKVDKYGQVRKWNQRLMNDIGTITEREFYPEDVVHIAVDKKPGYTFGTPYILPVLDDIRALRKLEELAITVVSKEAFPLVHYKVGTPEAPAIVYEGGPSEIDSVLGQIASLPAHGYVVTSERHEINLISKNGSIIDMSPYIEYFESRVMAGLRLSDIDVGRGGTSNRGTANTLSMSLENAAKDYQQLIATSLTYNLIIPLLMEGGFDVTPENMVKWSFPAINKEEERAFQNHGLQLLLGNAITYSEFRETYLSLDPLLPEQKLDTNLEATTEAQIRIVKSKPAAPAGGGTASASDITSAIKRSTANRSTPANQYGSKPKSRITRNDSLVEDYKTQLNISTSNLTNVLLSTKDLDEDAIVSFVDDKLHSFVASLVEISNNSILEAVSNGLKKAEIDFEKTNPETDYVKQEIGRRSLDRFFINFVSKSLWKVINPYKDQIYNTFKKDSEGNTFQVNTAKLLESIRKELLEMIDIQIITAERFGYIKFAKRMGCKTIDIIDLNTSSIQSVDISNLIYKNFIPQDSKENSILSFPKDSINEGHETDL